MTFKNALDSFISYGSSYLESSTVNYYIKNLGFFCNYLATVYTDYENTDINLIDRSIILEYIKYLRNQDKYSTHELFDLMNVSGKIKSTTIRTYMRAVKTFFNWLYDNGYIKVNPVRKLKLPKEDSEQIIPLTFDEVNLIESFLVRSGSLRNYCMFFLLLDAGLRSEEVCKLRKSDIFFSDRYILVSYSKGKKSRIVPLSDRLLSCLSTYISESDCANYLFTKRCSLEHVSYGAIRSLFRAVTLETGIKRLHAHLLRHTFATSYIMGGGDLESLRLLLGHYDYGVTKTYLHLAGQFNVLHYPIYQLDSKFFNKEY